MDRKSTVSRRVAVREMCLSREMSLSMFKCDSSANPEPLHLITDDTMIVIMSESGWMRWVGVVSAQNNERVYLDQCKTV